MNILIFMKLVAELSLHSMAAASVGMLQGQGRQNLVAGMAHEVLAPGDMQVVALNYATPWFPILQSPEKLTPGNHARNKRFQQQATTSAKAKTTRRP
jgi:hypothetical protein